MNRLVPTAGTLAIALFTGCSQPMSMKGELDGNMRLDSKLDGSLRLEGPIVMQLRGPTVRYDGVYVSEKVFDRIDPEKTGVDWLSAVLGEPTSKAPLLDGTEIWKWAYTPTEQEASVISLFGGSKDEPRLLPSTVYLRVNKGVVIEKWRD